MWTEINNNVLKIAVDSFCLNQSDGRVVWIWEEGKPEFDKSGLLWSDGVKPSNRKVLPNAVIRDERNGMLTVIDVVELKGPIDAKRREELALVFRGCKLKLRMISAFKTRTEYEHTGVDIARESIAWFADEPDHVICFNGKELIGPVT